MPRSKRPYNRETNLRYKDAHQERILFGEAKRRAKVRGIAFDIELADIVIPELCPVLNIPIFKTRGYAGPNSPSIDRVDNGGGYVKGNVRVISWRANCLKKDGMFREFVQVAKYVGPKITITNVRIGP